MKVHDIVIHYTATFPDQEVTAQIVRDWHLARNFRDIGYHYLIRRDGTVDRGRPETEAGAHVMGQNANKLGVAWAGGLERATGVNVGVWNPTPAQEASMGRLLGELLERHPGARVVGHRDLAATQCPGGDAGAWWAAWQAKQKAPAPTGLAAWFAALASIFNRRT